MGSGSLVLTGLEDVLLLGDLGAMVTAPEVPGTSRQEHHQVTPTDKDLQEWVVREGEIPRSEYKRWGFCHQEPEGKSCL